MIVHLHENFCNAVYRIIFDHLTMFILANLRVGEFKISHIISYLVQQFKTGVKLFTSVEGRKKTLYTVPLFILIIFFVEVIMRLWDFPVLHLYLYLPCRFLSFSDMQVYFGLWIFLPFIFVRYIPK